jgi:hypothetical protein
LLESEHEADDDNTAEGHDANVGDRLEMEFDDGDDQGEEDADDEGEYSEGSEADDDESGNEMYLDPENELEDQLNAYMDSAEEPNNDDDDDDDFEEDDYAIRGSRIHMRAGDAENMVNLGEMWDSAGGRPASRGSRRGSAMGGGARQAGGHLHVGINLDSAGNIRDIRVDDGPESSIPNQFLRDLVAGANSGIMRFQVQSGADGTRVLELTNNMQGSNDDLEGDQGVVSGSNRRRGRENSLDLGLEDGETRASRPSRLHREPNVLSLVNALFGDAVNLGAGAGAAATGGGGISGLRRISSTNRPASSSSTYEDDRNSYNPASQGLNPLLSVDAGANGGAGGSSRRGLPFPMSLFGDGSDFEPGMAFWGSSSNGGAGATDPNNISGPRAVMGPLVSDRRWGTDLGDIESSSSSSGLRLCQSLQSLLKHEHVIPMPVLKNTEWKPPAESKNDKATISTSEGSSKAPSIMISSASRTIPSADVAPEAPVGIPRSGADGLQTAELPPAGPESEEDTDGNEHDGDEDDEDNDGDEDEYLEIDYGDEGMSYGEEDEEDGDGERVDSDDDDDDDEADMDLENQHDSDEGSADGNEADPALSIAGSLLGNQSLGESVSDVAVASSSVASESLLGTDMNTVRTSTTGFGLNDSSSRCSSISSGELLELNNSDAAVETTVTAPSNDSMAVDGPQTGSATGEISSNINSSSVASSSAIAGAGDEVAVVFPTTNDNFRPESIPQDIWSVLPLEQQMTVLTSEGMEDQANALLDAEISASGTRCFRSIFSTGPGCDVV